MKIANYSVKEVIYQGKTSIIYRGYQEENQKAVIIKLLNKQYPSSVEIARFQHEYDILESLKIDGIAKPYGIIPHENTIALVIEDIENSYSLKQYLESQGKLSLDVFLKIAIKICECLGQIHLQNIIHKDIKPHNIILAEDNDIVKLIDFGIATQLSEEKQEIKNVNALEGTLAYISPEQTGRMNRAIDYRTDFYSLGISFFEMLVGKLPFDATDSMGWVHCHIAKTPPQPVKINPEVPLVLSEIIIKLMSKNAEDRYQSAFGIKTDLEECFRQLQENKNISTFKIANNDLSNRFQIPAKLYGRRKEIDTIMQAFSNISAGKSEMLLVSGYSGVGKSATINEVQKPIVERRGFFISGKFDQFKRNIPYSAITQSFQELVKQLLTEPLDILNIWKNKILEALKPNAQVIIDVIPEVELILGPQPSVPQLGPTEIQNRFNFTFMNFISVFTKKEHPLVVFLDDLQWADSATLSLLNVMMTSSSNQNLLIIGAYRDNEVDTSHPLIMTLNELQQQNVIIHTINLQPLGLNHVIRMVSESLHCNELEADPLAKLVMEKTGGNPFFITEFLKNLYREHLLHLSFERMGWVWELEKIEAQQITNNVIELLLGRLKKLPNATQQTIKLAACIGNVFELKLLSVICEQSISKTIHDLLPAIEEGMIIPFGEAHKLLRDVNELQDEVKFIENLHDVEKFQHDRVQQAAYNLINDQEKQEVHLKIGRLMLKNTKEEDLEEVVFNITNHLNIARKLIGNLNEKLELVKLNLMAGQKAKTSTAYQPAVKHLAIGMELLPDSCWENHYDLTFSLYKECAENEYLAGNHDNTEKLIEILLNKSKTKYDKTDVYLIRMTQLEFAVQYNGVINVGLDALKLGSLWIPGTYSKTAMSEGNNAFPRRRIL